MIWNLFATQQLRQTLQNVFWFEIPLDFDRQIFLGKFIYEIQGPERSSIIGYDLIGS